MSTSLRFHRWLKPLHISLKSLLHLVAFFFLWQFVAVANENPNFKSSKDPVIEYYLDQVNPDSLQSYMQSLENFGTRFALADNRKEVAEWIRDKFISFGYHDAKLDSFPFNRTFLGVNYATWQYNVICTYEGYTKPDSIFVLGAHHDSVNNYPNSDSFTIAPGADDNASGVAATLEIARIMKQYNYAPAYTIKFATFAAEEQGLYGAWDFANKAQAAGMNIACMLNNDMISHTSKPQEEWAVKIQKYSNSDYFTTLANYIIDNYTILDAVESIQYIQNSDSWPFFQKGYQAIFFIENDFTTHYHRSTDLVVNTNKYYAAEMTKISLGMLIHENGPGTTTTPTWAFWTGKDNSDWNENENWSNKLLPAENTTVVIHENSFNFPVIDFDLTLEALTVNPSTNITIAPEATLTVNSTLTNLAGATGIIIESNQNETGSLIHETPGVEATVQRYIASADWQNAIDGWHFVASPVSNQAINPSWTTSSPDEYDFYAWQNGWLNHKVSANNITHFIPGEGYLVAYKNSDTKLFKGALNTGQVDFTLSYSTGGDYAGFNLLGNPYPSAIDWHLADLSKFQDNFAYIYNTNKSGGAGYEAIDATFEGAIIAPAQGFFVLANDDQNGQVFSFDNSMRKHGGTWLKNNQISNQLKLKLRAGNNFDETEIRILDGSLLNRDQMDALKFFSFSHSLPQLFSLTANEIKVSVNTIPVIESHLAIALGAFFPVDGNYSISISEIGGLFSNLPLILHDAAAAILHDLKANPEYSFFATQGNFQNRFRLLFAHPTNNQTTDSDSAVVYFTGGNLFVKLSRPSEKTQVSIFDTSGRLVVNHQPEGGQSFSITLNLKPGIYLVRIFGEETSVTKKVFVK